MSDSSFDFEDEVNALVRLGTEPESARRLVARRRGVSTTPTLGQRVQRMPLRAEPEPQPETPTVTLPFTLTIPWSELCSDNERDEPYIRRVAGGKIVPAKRMTVRYREAKAAIKGRARTIAAGRLPIAGLALEIRVRVFLPPARRNDAINFSKCTHDALEGVVYANDNQLHRATWERAGVDIDAPRCEITITRLVPATQRLTQAA